MRPVTWMETVWIVLALASLAWAQPGTGAARLEANKKLLIEFFRLGGDLDARTKMLADDCVQHNPRFLRMDPEDPARTYEAFAFELFRIENGKLAEHWDGVKWDGVKLVKGWQAASPPAAR
jgi:predicted SnoaL-like aldol condensation-catalyzing enzyme